MEQSFVPENFEVPKTFRDTPFRLSVLELSVAEIDYQVVMSSRERLRGVFNEYDNWPADDLSLAANIRDLVRHQREFEARIAFAYAVHECDGAGYWGRIYIEPSDTEYDAEVYLWVSDAQVARDKQLYDVVKAWIANDWPFRRVAYPGREPSWPRWREITGP